VVGGLVVSQLLTLYITPVFYIYMERFRSFIGRRGGKKERKEKKAVAVAEPLPEPVLTD